MQANQFSPLSFASDKLRSHRAHTRRSIARQFTFGLIAALLIVPVAQPVTATSKTWLYVVDNSGARLLPVDSEALTLPVEITGSFAPTPSPDASPQIPDAPGWSASADGSTLVRTTVHHPFVTPDGSATITVFDTATGAIRSEFETPDWSRQPVQLSADGRRLAIEAGLELDHGLDNRLVLNRLPSWYIFDTTTGRQVAQVEGDGDAVAGTQRLGYLHPDGTRLYRFVTLGQQAETGPWPTQLVAVDLLTGEEIGRIDLPGVMSGYWWTGRTSTLPDGSPFVFDEVTTPSLAFSPNGDSLVVFDPKQMLATIVDTTDLSIVRQQPLSLPVQRTQTISDASATGCNQSPPPLCRGDIGPELFALQMPDPDHLLIGGYDATRTGEDEVTMRSFGLQVVNLNTGGSTAQASVDPDVVLGVQFGQRRVWSALDGSAYYVLGLHMTKTSAGSPKEEQPIPWHLFLYRLDANDLRVTAEQELTDIGELASPVVLAQPLPTVSDLN